MSDYEIVELNLNDLVKCASFWGYPNPRLEEFLKSGARKVFAYKKGDEYVGGCALIIGENQRGHFSDFFVREDLRGKGIGSRILEFAIDFLKKKNMKTVRLHVLKDNQTAIRLYARYGFTYFEDITPDKIAMIKNIL